MGLHNMAAMSTATTGTGTITLGSALAGFQSFAASGVVNGESVPYSIKDGANWEVGIGTYNSSGPTLARTTIYGSSNGGAAINLSGSAEVRISLIAEAVPGGNLSVAFESSTTTAGQNKDRTSGGTYTAHRAYITVTQPIKLSQVKWDVSSAKTYTVKIYRGWQFSSALANLGAQVTAGRTAEVTWSAGNLIMLPGMYTLELTWSGAAVVDDNNLDSSPAGTQASFSFFMIERTQYDTTFDTNFSAAIKLVAYLGTETEESMLPLSTFSELTEEASPASADLLVLEKAAGGKRKSTFSDASRRLYGYLKLEKPPSADWSWVNQGSATITTDADMGEALFVPAGSGVNWRLRERTLPATPWTVTAGFIFNPGMNTGNCQFGLGFRESTSGKLSFIAHLVGGQMEAQRWNSPSSFSSLYAGGQGLWRYSSLVFFRLSDDGTNRRYFVSADGVSFLTFHTVTRTDFLTADRICWGANIDTGNQNAQLSLVHWKVT